MLAALAGAVQIIKELVSCGAKLDLTEQYGRNAFELALLQVNHNRHYAQKVLGPCFKLLRPQQTSLKIANRVINLQAHQAEFLFLHYALAITPEGLSEQKSIIASFDFIHKEMEAVSEKIPPNPMLEGLKKNKIPTLGFSAKDIETFLEKLPPNSIPEHFKKRSYITSILTRNETEKKGKMLFARIAKGVYTFNPRLEILVDGAWKNLYEHTFLQMQVRSFQTSEGQAICRTLENPKWLALENEAIRFFENNRKIKN
jgi:hypothetical protein